MSSGWETVNILGVDVASLDWGGIMGEIERILQEGVPRWIITANAELVMHARADSSLQRILGDAHLVLADGVGLVWASRTFGRPVPAKIAGVELAEALCRRSASTGDRIFFLGAAPGVAEKAAHEMAARYPGFVAAGCHHGFFKTDSDEEHAVIQVVRDAKPAILFVALGMPRQERWIHAHLEELGVPVVMGVGGSLDVFAGVARRAPAWMCGLGLEWAYRLILNPWRARRMMALPRFAWHVVWARWHRMPYQRGRDTA